MFSSLTQVFYGESNPAIAIFASSNLHNRGYVFFGVGDQVYKEGPSPIFITGAEYESKYFIDYIHKSYDPVAVLFHSISPPLGPNYADILFGIRNLFIVDNLSISIIMLVSVLFPLCVLACWEVDKLKEIFGLLFVLQFFLYIAFTANNLFVFTLFFEGVIIPIVFLISGWGSRERRYKALAYLYIYTMLGSVFLLVAL